MMSNSTAAILRDPADDEPPIFDEKNATYIFTSTMGSYAGELCLYL